MLLTFMLSWPSSLSSPLGPLLLPSWLPSLPCWSRLGNWNSGESTCLQRQASLNQMDEDVTILCITRLRSGRHNRRLPQGIMRNRFHFSPRKQILCNLSYYRFWYDIYPILEITKNLKALKRIGSETARAQRKAFRFRTVGHLRCYVCLCSAWTVLLRFRVQCFNYLL